ncbi:GreA/GreB family elongation factor [Phaeovulum sp.]|uniref:GreA/GreB family elongation factor n=1 Tax=Phaeovulum sp. TaxID=2934796 RepID=UPI0039E2C0A6
MSKAFTKEDDGPENERLDDLPQSPHPNYVTSEGLQALYDRLSVLRAHLADLRAQGDETANRLAVAVAQRDIRFFQERINRAIPVDPATHTPGIVSFGAEIRMIDENDDEHIYRIVGEDEADPARGLIAPFSPLAVALMGAGVGDTVEWPRPTGAIDLEILAIRFP